MQFRQLFDAETSTYTYLLVDEASKKAVLIDCVNTQHERDLQLIKELGLSLQYILETHVHADHVTGASLMRKATGAKIGISEAAGISCADVYLRDNAELNVGSFKIRCLQTPGHTNGCMSYYVGDRVLTGDALLVRGTGRTDFQQGSSKMLYQTIREKLFKLPEDTLVFPGHDYKGRCSSTIGEEKQHNPRVKDGVSVEAFSKIMSDLKLAYPKMIDAAVPANLKCGDIESV